MQEIANAIVTKLGMNESIGYIGYEEDQFSKDFSDKTNEVELRLIEANRCRGREDSVGMRG